MKQNEFNKLLKQTEEAFDKSDIKKYAEENDLKWNFSVCSTRIIPNNILILGFNWGVGKDPKTGKLCNYNPQSQMPVNSFKYLYENNHLGSLQRIVPCLENYMNSEQLSKIGQSNFCFFRSRYSKQISKNDLDLCKPIFKSFLNVTRPSNILCFSSKLRDYLRNSNILQNIVTDKIPYISGKRECIYEALKGEIVDAIYTGTKIPLLSLPHPNSRIGNDARKKAWDFCFK